MRAQYGSDTLSGMPAAGPRSAQHGPHGVKSVLVVQAPIRHGGVLHRFMRISNTQCIYKYYCGYKPLGVDYAYGLAVLHWCIIGSEV
jgi:hypothetical protein